MKEIKIQDVCALISVFDMPQAVRFYCDVLGFVIESRSPAYAVEGGGELFHWCMLKAADARLMLNTAYDEGDRPAERPPQAEDPFGVSLFLGCPDLDEAYERLKARHVDCNPPKRVRYGSRYGFRTLSIRDPDGHGITLQWPDSPPLCSSE